MSLNVKKGDNVVILAGKDKGKEGTVKKTIASANRVIVEGINMVKKHQKPSNSNPNGGVIDTEAAISASNVMLIDPSTNEPTRVGFKFVDGKKVRFAKKSGKTID